MIFKFLRNIYRIFIRSLHWLNNFKKRYFNFVFPNLIFLISKRVNYRSYPICNQKVILTGAGIAEIGQNCTFGYKPGGFHKGGQIEIQARYKDAFIKIGDNVVTNNNLYFCAANYIEIGNNTLLGRNVSMMDSEGHRSHPEKRHEMGKIGEIVIGQNVMIGNDVVILRDTKIGDNSIVALGAVVKGHFPDNVIIGGMPARIIKPL